MIPAFLFSQLSVSSHYLGVNWAYWRKPYTSQPLYLSHFIYPNFSLSGDLPKKRLFYSLYAIQRPYGIPYFSDYYMLFLCDPIIITKVAHW